jgi:hypothetical protein
MIINPGRILRRARRISSRVALSFGDLFVAGKIMKARGRRNVR